MTSTIPLSIHTTKYNSAILSNNYKYMFHMRTVKKMPLGVLFVMKILEDNSYKFTIF